MATILWTLQHCSFSTIEKFHKLNQTNLHCRGQNYDLLHRPVIFSLNLFGSFSTHLRWVGKHNNIFCSLASMVHALDFEKSSVYSLEGLDPLCNWLGFFCLFVSLFVFNSFDVFGAENQVEKMLKQLTLKTWTQNSSFSLDSPMDQGHQNGANKFITFQQVFRAPNDAVCTSLTH